MLSYFAPATLYSPETFFSSSAFGTHLCYRLSKSQGLVQLKGLGNLNGNQTHA
jgi:hypothetical protein